MSYDEPRVLVGVVLLALAMACGDDTAPEDTAPEDAAPEVDAGLLQDAATADTAAGEDTGAGEIDATVEQDAGAPADTWSTFAMGFFATYCVECHSGAATMSPRDYRTIDDVRRDQMTVACGVSPDPRPGCAGVAAPSQFPIGSGPRPSDEERRRLVQWVDDGLSD